MDLGPICEPSLRNQIQTYEEHSTHRAHYWRRRPRRCARTNTTVNSPSTETSLIAAGFKAKKPQNPKQQKLYDGRSADRWRRSYARVGAPGTKDGGHLIVNRVAKSEPDWRSLPTRFQPRINNILSRTRMRFAKMSCPKMLVRGFHLIRKAGHRWTQIFTDVRRSEFLNLCFIRVNPWRNSFPLSWCPNCAVSENAGSWVSFNHKSQPQMDTDFHRCSEVRISESAFHPC